MTAPATIVWFRLDLRLEDNPALRAAAARGGAVIPVFVQAPEEEAPWAPGAASNWWLHRSLARLGEALEARGSALVIRSGPTIAALRDLVRETGADAVYWNRRYEPAVIARDGRVEKALAGDGVEARSFNAALLFEPWTIETQQGGPYKVFTPYYRACLAAPEPPGPEPAPRRLIGPGRRPRSQPLAALGLEPRVDWAAGMRACWTPGETGGKKRLAAFLREAVVAYPGERDRPGVEGTSRLSPHLHFGEIGPRAVWHAARREASADRTKGRVKGTEAWLRQLVWREFAHHMLFHFPRTSDEPLREEFSAFPWKDEPSALRAWRRGRTGYPIVDAGMRELWRTGWMHNRVRMIVASFLVKDLLVPWQRGARWFWDTLVDADLANNTFGWQWTAGCGADAAPYFRVFNPVLQGARYDADGAYVRRWVPEIAALPGARLNEPWNASPVQLAAAGVALGKDYPSRIVDHAKARDAALRAYDRIKGGK